MTSKFDQLEAALGGKLEQSGSRSIPGLYPRNGAEVVYFSVTAQRNHRKQFRNITSFTNPPFAQYGGVSESGCFIELPDGTFFYALTYHGDLEGWRRDIDEGAKAYGSILARIEGDNLILVDGKSFSLAACKIGFI